MRGETMRMKDGRAVSYARVLSAGLIALAMAGCGTPPQERFFTLASEAPPAQSGAVAAGPGFSIVVGPVSVPDVVDRPQFVLQSTPTEVEIAEQARWAAPLKTEIARVVADDLARVLDGARTAIWTQHATGTADYRVLIDIQRFDSVPQEGATIHALWTVTAKDGTPLAGRSVVTEPAAAGYDALVAAHSRALASISREIAAAIAAARIRNP
jgi:uncharacterized lipoprotein YmbA